MAMDWHHGQIIQQRRQLGLVYRLFHCIVKFMYCPRYCSSRFFDFRETFLDRIPELFGLEISDGGIAVTIAPAGKLASDCAAGTRPASTSSPMIQSDETRSLVKRQNHWYWAHLCQPGTCQLFCQPG